VSNYALKSLEDGKATIDITVTHSAKNQQLNPEGGASVEVLAYDAKGTVEVTLGLAQLGPVAATSVLDSTTTMKQAGRAETTMGMTYTLKAESKLD
jgi:hypothetical protein